MEFQEWEFISNNIGRRSGSKETGLDPRGGVVDMNYFTSCPPPPSLLLQSMEEDSAIGNQRQAPVGPEPNVESSPDAAAENETEEISTVVEKNPNVPEGETEVIGMATPGALASAMYQAFFDKMEENGYDDDIKAEAEKFGFELMDDSDEEADEMEKEEEDILGSEIKGKKAKIWESFNLSNCRSKLSGIGALRSIGVAAATLCMVILSGHQGHHRKPELLRSQNCGGVKGIKQVEQQALSTVDGAPVTTARISFGGYLKASASRGFNLDDMLL